MFADPSSPAFLAGALPDRARLAPTRASTSPRRSRPAPASAGTSTTTTCSRAAGASSGPATAPTSSQSWMPALDGVEEKLQAGGRVADVGCGHGASTILMAQAFPNSTFVGSDYHDGSIARRAGAPPRPGVGDRVTFSRSPPPTRSPAGGYDLVTCFDCLHDMGDPVGAARHVRAALAPDGTWMIVEPLAGDRVEDNLNPVGRAYYAFSTLLCTPALAVAGGRARARRPGGRGAAARGARVGRASPASGARPRRRSTSCWRRARRRVVRLRAGPAGPERRASASRVDRRA